MTKAKFKIVLLLIIPLCFTGLLGFGQKPEVSINVYSGLFSFRGNGSTAKSWINFNPYTSPEKFTSAVYGKKSAFSYGFELQEQYVTKGKNIFGLRLNFEALTSKVNIDTITGNGFIYGEYPATGKTTLRNTFVTLSPFAGHRYLYHKMAFDLSAGLDFGFCLTSKEHGNATADNSNYSLQVDNARAKPLLDFRPRIQIKAQSNKLGFLAGYSLGLTNYYQTQNNLKAYTRFLRLGLSYQIR